jgi:hypothetical protein
MADMQDSPLAFRFLCGIRSGILFPIKAKDELPVEHIVIRSVAVRGQLGPLSVWVSKLNETLVQGRAYEFPLCRRHWTKVYEAVHEASPSIYQVLPLESPVLLRRGQVRAIYIHSQLPGDKAIIYGNRIRHLDRNRRPRCEDALVSIFAGKAHLSPEPFGSTSVLGGNAWRSGREFVGKIEYGYSFKLWSPTAELHWMFGPGFRSAVRTLLNCRRRSESSIAMLPNECFYYIVHMCPWDWFGDNSPAMKSQKRLLREKKREAGPSSTGLSEASPTDEPPRGPTTHAIPDYECNRNA